MTTGSMLESMTIFQKYGTGEISAEHDQVFVGGQEAQIDPVDLGRLEELGWFWDDHTECWSHYT